jgi:hypothetical protein
MSFGAYMRKPVIVHAQYTCTSHVGWSTAPYTIIHPSHDIIVVQIVTMERTLKYHAGQWEHNGGVMSTTDATLHLLLLLYLHVNGCGLN